jgi:hypothetical protein
MTWEPCSLVPPRHLRFEDLQKNPAVQQNWPLMCVRAGGARRKSAIFGAGRVLAAKRGPAAGWSTASRARVLHSKHRLRDTDVQAHKGSAPANRLAFGLPWPLVRLAPDGDQISTASSATNPRLARPRWRAIRGPVVGRHVVDGANCQFTEQLQGRAANGGGFAKNLARQKISLDR